MAYNLGALPRKVKVLLHASWYRVEDFMDLLKGFRQSNPHVISVRTQLLESLNNAACEAPFAVGHRFPDHQDYICDVVGDWPTLLQQVHSALSFKERDVGNKRVEGERTQGDFQSQQDSMLAFWSVTTAMLDKITKLSDVLDRETFEAKYGLEWH